MEGDDCLAQGWRIEGLPDWVGAILAIVFVILMVMAMKKILFGKKR